MTPDKLNYLFILATILIVAIGLLAFTINWYYLVVNKMLLNLERRTDALDEGARKLRTSLDWNTGQLHSVTEQVHELRELKQDDVAAIFRN